MTDSISASEALRQIRGIAGNSDYYLRYTNATVHMAASILRVLQQVETVDWQQRALEAELENISLRAQLDAR